MKIEKIIYTSILLLSCNNLFYVPSRKSYYDPKSFGYKYRDIYFYSIDKTRLNGWFIYSKKPQPKGTVIQFHGNAENISSHFYSLVWLTNYGFNLFTFDYRGYGKSEGVAYREGIRLDGLSAIKFIENNPLKLNIGKHIIIYGQSIGGVVAIESLSLLKNCKDLSLLIIESSFPSYREIASSKVDRGCLIVLSPFVPVLIDDDGSPKMVAKRLCKIKKLIIHGTKDKIVPIEFGLKLYKILPPPKKLWIIKGGGHINTFFIDNQIYRKKFLKILNNLLKN